MTALLIVVPVYGQHHLTHDLVRDLEREHAAYLIVDNRGDYPMIANEQVLRTPGNLHWAGGTQLGFQFGFITGYQRVMTLNNDTRLSKGFVAAFLDSRLPPDAGVVGPMIDHGFLHAEVNPAPAAAEYIPQPRCRKVLAVEGTALMMTRACWERVGGFDLRFDFGRHAWGADIDLAARARNSSFGVYITEMAYINHFGHRTVDVPTAAAAAEMGEMLHKKYGPNWHSLTPGWRVGSGAGSMKFTVYTVRDL